MQSELNAINRVSGNEISLQVNQAGDALQAQGDAEFADATRGGRRFSFMSTTSVAAVVAIPTVAHCVAFTNSDPDGGRSAVIDAVFAVSVGGGAAAALGQCHMIFVIGQTQEAVLVNSALIPRKLNGTGPGTDTCLYITEGAADNLNAVTGVAIGWTPIGPTRNMTVANTPGIGLWAEVNGRIILPPNRVFALHVMASQVDMDFNMGMMWHEKQITLG